MQWPSHNGLFSTHNANLKAKLAATAPQLASSDRAGVLPGKDVAYLTNNSFPSLYFL